MNYLFKKSTSGFWMTFVLGLVLLFILGSCEQEPRPEDTVRSWITYMSTGECEKAFDLEVQSVREVTPLADCEPFTSEIRSITCELTQESALCTCKEVRNSAPEKIYDYDLKKVDGGWKMAMVSVKN